MDSNVNRHLPEEEKFDPASFPGAAAFRGDEQIPAGDFVDLNQPVFRALEVEAPSLAAGADPLMGFNPKDAYLADDNAPQRILENAPEYIEKNTSFDVVSYPDDIFALMEEFFRSKNIHFVASRDTYAIQFVFYQGGFSARAVASVFQGNPNCVVEFQRRCGCPLAFRNVYDDFHRWISELHSHILNEQVELNPPIRYGAPQAPAISLDADTVSILYQMAADGCISTKQQCLGVLSEAAGTDKNLEVLLSFPAISEAMEEFLTVEDADVLRCCAAIIARLCTLETGRSALKPLSPRIDALCRDLADSVETSEARAQLASASRLLSGVH